MKPALTLVLFLLTAASGKSIAQPGAATPAGSCGEVVKIETHDRTTMRYALAGAQNARITLVLLIGGGGNIDLDDKGCPQALSRNVLVRMQPHFLRDGFATALVDAPSDYAGGDGLAEFRMAPQHADDLGKVIGDLRARTNGAVWLIGHSRGTISAANAAARLSGAAAPDGVVLMSAMMAGDARARKAFVAQTVFYASLDAVRMPVLVVGHAADSCVRSPPELMANITAKTQSVREQVATVTGGPVAPGRPPGLAACEVHEPHDFTGQEAEIAAGIARFARGGNF